MESRRNCRRWIGALTACAVALALSGCASIAQMEGTKIVLFPKEDPHRDTVVIRVVPGPAKFTDWRIDLDPQPSPCTYYGSDMHVDFPEEGKWKVRIEKPGFVPVEFVADGALFRGRNEMVFCLQPDESQ